MEANLGGQQIIWERYWDELGRPETDILSNGMRVERSYDAAGRLLTLTNEIDDRPISNFDYSYNPAGTIKELTKTFISPEQDTIGKYVLAYTYDNLDRLVSASTDGVFEYDPLGNQLQRSGTYNEINQLQEDSEFSYSYSINGNLSSKASKIIGEKIEYFWDNENKLTHLTVRNADNSIKKSMLYKYDGNGRRIAKEVNGSRTNYLYDNEDIVLELGDNNILKAMYLHGPGIDEPIAMIRDINGNGAFEEDELFFYTKDHLNSIHALTNKDGRPVQRYNYSAYGKTKIEKTSAADKLVKNPYGYTSREWDEETGDYYYRARYYDPSTGRFLTPDPIGFKGGDANLYRYVGNNPVLYVDPYGKNRFAIAVGGLLVTYLFYKYVVDPNFVLIPDAFPKEPESDPKPPGPSCNPGLQSCEPPGPKQCN